MNTSFLDISKKVANDFLQNIVFIDDRAYTEKSEEKEVKRHDFDAPRMSKVFAKEQKICAIYKPENLDEIGHLQNLARKADVTIIDWQINIPIDAVTAEDAETDADDDDPRGAHTKQLIRSIVQDSVNGNGSLKLILVYTGDVYLEEITEDIKKNLEEFGVPDIQSEDCKIQTKNITILVAAKPILDSEDDKERFKHNPNLKSKVIEYENLPGFILEEFTNLTNGLLSNFALLALTTIRNNSHRVLNLFSKDLDAAYLGHKALLPNQDDAEDQLIDLLKDSLGDLLHYTEISKELRDYWIKTWVKEKYPKQPKPILKSDKKLFKNLTGIDLNGTYTLTDSMMNDILVYEEFNVDTRLDGIFSSITDYQALTKDQKKEFCKYLVLNSTNLFVENGVDYSILDNKFATLTHHKNLFKPSLIAPKLTLGTIIRGLNNKEKYWVCIQQKCDSVRLKKGDIRKFLFLPIKIVPATSFDKFHFVDTEGNRLKLIVKSYEIRTIKFESSDEGGVIQGKPDNSNFIFHQYYSDTHSHHKPGEDENFEWVFDLKDLHSQRIANEIASTLSRVGLDESEWLRRKNN